jgi:hypothetical protein
MPYLSLIRLGGVAVLAIALFFAGWTVNGWRLDKQIAARENALLAQAVEAQKKAAAEIKRQADVNEEVVSAHEEAAGKLNSQITALKEKLKHARLTVPNCEHPFTTDLPRALNRLSVAAEGRVLPGAPAPETNPEGTPAAPAPTSVVDGGALVDHYAEVMRIFGQCKSQLDAIREWDAK